MRVRANAKIVIVAIVLMTLLFCGKKQPQSGSPAAAQENPQTTTPQYASAPAQATRHADLVFVLSPGSLGGSRLFPSWPLILNVAVWRKQPTKPEATAPPITIKAKIGAWSEALVITVKNAADEVVQWPWHPVKQDAAELNLDIGGAATAEWWLAPEETSSLAEGDYTITMTFDPARVEGLPAGTDAIQSDNYNLRVVKEPATLDPDQQEEKLFIAAWLSIIQDDKAGVEEKAGKILALNPQSIGGRRLKAALLAREGKKMEALTLLNEALDIYDRKFPKADPPGGILEERYKILKTIKPAEVKSDKATEKADAIPKKR